MSHRVGNDIVELVGLGLGANYVSEVASGHPRHPDMIGGLTPRLAPTGDPAHDAAIKAGRFATNWGICHLILLPLWKVYAVATGLGLYLLGHDALHLNVLWLGGIVWLALQILFLRFWGRIFDGRSRYTRVQRRAMRKARTASRRQRRRNRGQIVTTEVIDGRVVLVPVSPRLEGQRTALKGRG